MAPALKYWPLNLELGACLKACHSGTERATDMKPTVINSCWLQLYDYTHMGRVTKRFCCQKWSNLIFTYLTVRYLKLYYTNVIPIPFNPPVYSCIIIYKSQFQYIETYIFKLQFPLAAPCHFILISIIFVFFSVCKR